MTVKVSHRWTPRNWASLAPFGIGHQRPNNYWELARAAIESRDRLGFAWRILNQGVCDGCALGTTGMKDWTLDGTHLCNIRLRLLRLNTAPPFDPSILADAGALEGKKSGELRELGRLPRPMLRRAGEKGFSAVSWDEALDLAAARLRDAGPDGAGFYVTSRGMPNEGYYAVQKAVRAMGFNSVDNAARICHSPSTTGLKETVGVAATTCSYSDWIESDLVVFIGSNVANNQPVATKYLHYAKKNNLRVVAINSHREPGMERYWIPSIAESSLFGTKISDKCFLVNQGSDVAFLNGVMKHLAENGWVDGAFVEDRTSGYDALAAHVRGLKWEDLEADCGATRAEMLELATMIRDARKAVFVWSMGITQHVQGVENVKAIVNLALSGGFIGRAGCGLMPIRGHSGVQGGAEMGCYATAFPGGLPVNEENARHFRGLWGFEVPSTPGRTAMEMIEGAHDGTMGVLFSVGGNFLEAMPDPGWVREALARVPLRVHMDIVLSSQMLVESEGDVLLLPATTRYEVPGGVTETSTERRVIFSPEVPGPRVAEARGEADVLLDLARRTRPEIAGKLAFDGTAALRRDIARDIPMYAGIEKLAKQGDAFQYGGPHLCAGGKFPTPDGRARFSVVSVPRDALPDGAFHISTRRGKQFNTMVHESLDAITGHEREAILMSAADATRLGLAAGDRVRVHNKLGELRAVVAIAHVKPGNLQMHWPEGNVLLDKDRRCGPSGVPDYNAIAFVEKLP